MKESLKYSAIKTSLRLALFFTSITFGLIAIGLITYNKHSFKKEIREKILTISNSLDFAIQDFNIEKLAPIIQRSTKLQEFSIFDKDCKTLSTTSLKISHKDCLSNSPSFEKLDIYLKNNSYVLFFIPNIEIKDFLFKSLDLLGLTFLLLILFFTSGIYFFFYLCILSPLEKIRSEINNPNIKVPGELSFITHKITELRDEIIHTESERAYFSCARTILHDIRNPLQVIKQLNDTNRDKEEINKKLNEINLHIRSMINDKQQQRYFKKLDLNLIFKEVTSEVSLLYPIKINVDCPDNLIITSIEDFEIKNILTNLIRNSTEASSSEVFISLEKEDSKLNILVLDNGTGITADQAQKLFKNNFTTKNSGNGIGLSSTKQFLLKLGGDLNLRKSDLQETVFVITLPDVRISENIILIEDDKYLQLAWKIKAQSQNREITTFKNVSEMMRNSSLLNKDSTIFIDRELKDGERGDLLSKLISSEGFKNLYLASNYDDISLEKTPWIKGLFSKDVNLIL